MRYCAAYDVAILMVTACFNADDLEGEATFMYNPGYKAKELPGYTTAECSTL
jgi:hypothetical protein